MIGASSRLPVGGLIDRARALNFRFNGRAYSGFAGDTLASALLANGVRVVARSFKYHRPRGVLGAGVEEPNALVEVEGADGEPAVPATCLPLIEGMSARSVNCWPNADWDIGAINDRFWRLLPAGFYYKTFMGPGAMWKVYERVIRRAAGLGRIPAARDTRRFARRFDHCDVLVAGAGPAGIAAALAAGRSGARVLIVDEQDRPGGDLLGRAIEIAGKPAQAWVDSAIAELDAMPEVRRLRRATVAGFYDDNLVTVFEREPAQGDLRHQLRRVRARQVVLASGAIERPLVFANNDRPGVMLAGAARLYATHYGVAVGRRAIVATNNSSGYAAAFELADYGIEVAALVDLRREPDAALAAESHRRGITLLAAHAVVDIDGRRSVRGAWIAALEAPARARRLDCDLVAMSGGWNPTVHLFSQAGGKLRFDPDRVCLVPDLASAAVHVAGAANGSFALEDCLRGGWAVGTSAAVAAGYPASSAQPFAVSPSPPFSIAAFWEAPRRQRATRAFVDFQNDVTADDIRLAAREGYGSVEHAKRYTTGGMGIDQGKTGNLNFIGILAEARGVATAAVGVTTFRPPFTPVSFGAIAGAGSNGPIRPSRTTTLTEWHERRGATMFEAGALWRRPGLYPKPGEAMAETIARECLAARTGVGIYDSSPLGKIEIRGRDAALFVDRLYTNDYADLAIGQGRYGIMLREDGRIFDDGVTFRLGETLYLMSTTTGNADAVYASLERLLQCEWPALEVYLTVVTSQWTNAAVCGPLARSVLARAGTDIDLDRAAFPFMAIRSGRVAGLPARVARVSFTGELSFELNVPSRHGIALWEALMAAGEPLGITPIGSEASHVLRIEKGFISVGHEADGIANPIDLGMGWIVSRRKSDFIGKRSLARDAASGGVRRQLVGLLSEDPGFVLPEGAQLLLPGGAASLGHVTASTMSPILGRSIALALLDDGRQCVGRTVIIPLARRDVRAIVTKPAFYDPKGERLRS